MISNKNIHQIRHMQSSLVLFAASTLVNPTYESDRNVAIYTSISSYWNTASLRDNNTLYVVDTEELSSRYDFLIIFRLKL